MTWEEIKQERGSNAQVAQFIDKFSGTCPPPCSVYDLDDDVIMEWWMPGHICLRYEFSGKTHVHSMTSFPLGCKPHMIRFDFSLDKIGWGIPFNHGKQECSRGN